MTDAHGWRPIDLDDLADNIEGAATALSNAANRLCVPYRVPGIPPEHIHVLQILWRLTGHLEGMAEALRIRALPLSPSPAPGAGT